MLILGHHQNDKMNSMTTFAWCKRGITHEYHVEIAFPTISSLADTKTFPIISSLVQHETYLSSAPAHLHFHHLASY